MAEIDPKSYPRLKDGVVWRGLETPHLFHIGRDELYELDESGLEFLDDLDMGRRVSQIGPREVLEFALNEGLVELRDAPAAEKIRRGKSPLPSLRYLETILTLRCNLRCFHCYLGEQKITDLAPGLLPQALAGFDEMQGLRLLLSGGEPLLYPHWSEVVALFRGRGFRVVLLSNGTILDDECLGWLPAQEVQLSLDGLRDGHEAIRGTNTFDRTVAAARAVRASGRDLSIATMIHAALGRRPRLRLPPRRPPARREPRPLRFLRGRAIGQHRRDRALRGLGEEESQPAGRH